MNFYSKILEYLKAHFVKDREINLFLKTNLNVIITDKTLKTHNNEEEYFNYRTNL